MYNPTYKLRALKMGFGKEEVKNASVDYNFGICTQIVIHNCFIFLFKKKIIHNCKKEKKNHSYFHMNFFFNTITITTIVFFL